MDFDGDLFDINFDELAMFDGQQQQVQSQNAARAATALDFQDFCNEFSSNGSLDLGSVPDWNPNLVSTGQQDTMKADVFDFSFSGLKGEPAGKDSFEGLAPMGNDLQALFNFNTGSDAQVVPDMGPSAAHTPDFMLPTVTQPTTTSAHTQGNSDPYSWVQSVGCMPLGYPARPRPSMFYMCLFLAFASCPVLASSVGSESDCIRCIVPLNTSGSTLVDLILANLLPSR